MTVVQQMNQDGSVSSCLYSPDGCFIVSGSYDNTVRIWDVMLGKEIRRMKYNSQIYSCSYSPDERFIVFTLSDGTIKIFDAMLEKEIYTFQQNCQDCKFSPNCKDIVIGDYFGYVKITRLPTQMATLQILASNELRGKLKEPIGLIGNFYLFK